MFPLEMDGPAPELSSGPTLTSAIRDMHTNRAIVSSSSSLTEAERKEEQRKAQTQALKQMLFPRDLHSHITVLLVNVPFLRPSQRTNDTHFSSMPTWFESASHTNFFSFTRPIYLSRFPPVQPATRLCLSLFFLSFTANPI